MELAKVLEENRDAILRKWYDRILGSYPRAATDLLANHRDRFRNPVGHAIREGIGPILDQILSGMDPVTLRDALDRIVRIRSVQEFTPSGAVGFMFELKPVIREALNGGLSESRGPAALAAIESRIDSVALLAFDKYTECREQLHEVRVKQLRGVMGIPPIRPDDKGAASHEEGEQSHEGD